MSNINRYDQMASDSITDNNSALSFYKFKFNPHESLHSKLFKKILGLCFAFVIVLVFYLTITRSSQLKRNKAMLLEIELQYKQIKAQSNDYYIQIKKLNQDKAEIQEEIAMTKDSINIVNKDSEELQKRRSDIDKQRKYYQNEINKLSQLLIDFEEAIKLHNELIKIQETMKTLSAELNQFHRPINDRRKIDDNNNLNSLYSNDNEGYIKDQITSNIITTQKQANLIKQWLSATENILILEPCYRMSIDGYSASTFHANCDKLSNTITFYKVNKDNIFGGFTRHSWARSGFKRDRNAFLFNLSTGKKYLVNNSNYAIYTHKHYFPSFGDGDLQVWNDEAISYFPLKYGSVDTEKNELTKGLISFEFEEIEVHRVLFEL